MKTYVQIGTAYGKDFFYNYIKDLNPSETNIVLVEPLQHEASIEFYKNTPFMEHGKIDCLKNAIVPNGFKDKTVEMYLFGGDLNLSSALNRMAIPSNNVVFIPALQIHELLDSAIKANEQTDEIEFLCIDAEGLDVELLNSIDYEKYNIRNIFFEYWDFDDDANNVYKSKSKYAELDEKLKNNGFTIKETIDTDGNTNFLYRKP
jgi:hypothetical protein